MTLRRFSQFLALALAVLTWWVLISRPDVIDPEFAVALHVTFAVVVLVVFALAFLVLRFASGGSAAYWSTKRTDQVRPIVWMILAELAVTLAASVILHQMGRADPASQYIVFLLAGTLVPAAFLQFGLITWPSRSGYPGMLRLFLISAFALCIAAAWTWAAYSRAPAGSELPPVLDLVVSMGAVIIGATLEEVIFRVLLLTALLDRSGSRFNAVFLSSVAFGLMHVPGALADPALHGDFAYLPQVAFEYAPQFIMQTMLGLVLGLLWLRTGSITLIALTHAIMNVGNVLAFGLLSYG
ncbi:CPBP family intramembrane glutamic endopeptidase [Brevundimonas sp. Root1423]|uniref:CPBP family intramembrane glutamic endopeptidase n=1 Tax=Brevundimonas sp. Root1423 TaxID=1736462 RepID=UPI0006F6BD5F|nr:CPBP family intramembrane glutamic endopeptidase [Brevundimonas sp. Root1423]KQY75530.1 hypothetical protein ASD25_13455 [Brevundimonas sp. Root1423]